jgi:hypothetical protein
MRYQQFASYAYCVAAGPVSKMALQQEKAYCVFRFEVSRSVITVQRDFFLWGCVKDSVYVPPLPTPSIKFVIG